LQQDEVLKEIANDALHFSDRILMIYANFHLNKTDELGRNAPGSGDRSRLLSIIPSDIIYFENERLTAHVEMESIVLERLKHYVASYRTSFML
jgi:hypothetical protein